MPTLARADQIIGIRQECGGWPEEGRCQATLLSERNAVLYINSDWATPGNHKGESIPVTDLTLDPSFLKSSL